MVYERGVAQHPDDRCGRCRAGQGISPQCVVASAELLPDGKCSNCLFDNADCGSTPSRVASELAKGGGDSVRVVDHMAVLGAHSSVEETAWRQQRAHITRQGQKDRSCSAANSSGGKRLGRKDFAGDRTSLMLELEPEVADERVGAYSGGLTQH